MDKEKIEHVKKLKGIKILDFLMFFGRNKIGFKFLEDKERTHYTITFLPEGIVDFHETIEGKEKRYPKKGRLELKKFTETMRETLERELLKTLKEIDINDPRYESVEVTICPKKEAIKKAIEVRKRKITVDESKFYDMFSRVRMKDLPDYDFQVAFWGKEGEEHALYRINGRYFILKVDDFVKLFDEIFKNLNVQDSG